MKKRYTISDIDSSQRIDKYLRKMYPANSLSSIFKAFRMKDVRVNGKAVKQDYILKTDDTIDVYLKKEEKDIENINYNIERTFKIKYEDENLLIVSKPIGVSVQEDVTSGGYSLTNQVLAYLIEKKVYNPKTDLEFKPSLVHRLDKNTSGLVIFAKNYITSKEFFNFFKSRTNIRRFYLALVKGKVEKNGEIKLSLEKKTSENIAIISNKGNSAYTKYKPLLTNDMFSLVEVEIITGRTHQIRAHMSAIGHPLVGDRKYGDYEFNKETKKLFNIDYQFLHAYKLKFHDITGRFSYLNDLEIIDELSNDKNEITTKIFGKK